MATAQTVINSALRKLGALGVGETPDATESAECLTVLNQLLESLSVEAGLIWAEQEITKAVTAGTASMAIGSSATWDTARPAKIIAAQWVNGSSDPSDITVDVPLAEFKRLSAVSTTGDPTILNYEATVANGTLQWYPTPAENGTMKLVVWVPPQTGVSLSTAFVMPPAYERMLVYELAIDLAPDYEVTLSDRFYARAQMATAQAKRPNAKTPLLRAMPGLPGMQSRRSILRDE